MTRIAIQVLRIPHAPASTMGYELQAIRLVSHVCFKKAAGWTAYRPAIVDTGAAVSLLPESVWREIEFETIGPVKIGGVIAKDECRVSANLGTVNCALSDGATLVGPFHMWAYLAESDQVPLLLGFCDLLELGQLTAHASEGVASFEI